MTDGTRKFIWLPRIGQEQFFNLDQDPGETRNLIDAPGCADEINQWRNYLVKELAERTCGWVKDGKPYCPDNAPLVSPFKDARWPGNHATQKDGTEQLEGEATSKSARSAASEASHS